MYYFVTPSVPKALQLFLVATFALLCFTTAVPSAEAISWAHSGTYISCGGDDSGSWCFPEDTGTLLNVTANTNKTTYQPGETVTLSMAVYNYLCSNIAILYDVIGSLGSQSSVMASAAIGGYTTQYPSATFIAPTTPGTYNVSMNVCTYYVAHVCTTRSITITVAPPLPPASAILSGSGCQIAAGANSCMGTATWSITNATSPVLVNSTGAVYSNSPMGNGVAISLPYGQSTVSAQNSGTVLASTMLTTSCATGLSWDGNKCVSPTATISGSGCTIETLGENRCAGTATWNISNASSPNVYNGNGTTYSISPSGTDENINLLYGVNTIYARNAGVSLASTNLTVTCGSGLVWNGSSCNNPPPPAPQIRVSVDKELIRSGDTVVTTTEVTAAYGASCMIYGVLGSPIAFTHTPTSSNTSVHTYPTRPLTSTQVISVTCEANPAIPGVPTATGESRVDVVPTIEET